MKLESRNSMPLVNFEFTLFKKLVQLEKEIDIENSKILINLQISGGKDSMCLLNAFSTVFSSKICKLKNTYIVVAQHFNHRQRLQESDEDAFFVAAECLKRGIPIYINKLPNMSIKNNYQEQFRDWRKGEANILSTRLLQEFNCTRYFIVTAHHGRDHVETVLLHLLRGSGIEGLKGISFLDEEKVYLRPFYAIPFEKIENYSNEMSVLFREDSSNLDDKYKRNYIRKHILPHLKYLQQDYENSFIKLSQHVQNISQYLSPSTMESPLSPLMLISKTTSYSEIFYFFKSKIDVKDISENFIKNILYESKLLLQKKEDKFEKEILLPNSVSCELARSIKLLKKLDVVECVIEV